MQALTVYILARLQEGENVDNNHDVLLLSTLWVIPAIPTLRDCSSSATDCSLYSERACQFWSLHRSFGARLWFNPARMDLRRVSTTVWQTQLHLVYLLIFHRRLSLVYQMLKMLYSLDPATSCTEPDGFLLAPLPSRRQLWESLDAQAWVVEKSRDGMFPSVFGVLTGGKMVKLQEQQVIIPDEIYSPLNVGEEESATNWQDWGAGIDGLGTLVTLAVTLA